jgi:hypothetical protein
MIVWTPSSTNPEQAARDLVSGAQYLHSTFKDEIWLWRGQADYRFGVEPGMHTRVRASKRAAPEDNVLKATQQLIGVARQARLDDKDGLRLPDLALLAALQHHGAATPLLDVTTDPLIALWMVAFASAKEPDALDHRSGRLFGILRPPSNRWIEPLDARPLAAVAGDAGGTYLWYRAPEVTERLRIQRGSFILGGYNPTPSAGDTSLHVDLGDDAALVDGLNYVERRIAGRGDRGGVRRKSEMFAIQVRGAVKRHLRNLLEDRSGLSIAEVYPTPWHQPFIETFSRAYGRARPLDMDVKELNGRLVAVDAVDGEPAQPGGAESEGA